MQPLARAAISTFQSVRFVLTDMDETLTYQGRLAARTYAALERLQQAGVKVIVVTAAPAGWCDQMARMWPVDGVIGENGGCFFHRNSESHGLCERSGIPPRIDRTFRSGSPPSGSKYGLSCLMLLTPRINRSG